MAGSASLQIRHKDAVSALNGRQATVTATRRDDRGVIHVALFRKDRQAPDALGSMELTIPQAMRLRSILAAAVRAALPDDQGTAATGVSRNADSAASEAAGGDRHHVGAQG